MKEIYVVFSSTPYKIGKFIRFFTREEYNHVSVMFDENMLEAYSFGRKHIDTPFWGGIIKDSISRYKYKNALADICVCKIPVEDEKYFKAFENAKNMYENRDLFVYNLFSAGVSVFRKRLFIHNAYTCVEFCAYILGIMLDNIDQNGFYTVGELLEVFKEYSIYKGQFNILGSEDADFTDNKGIRASFKGFLSVVSELVKRMRAC